MARDLVVLRYGPTRATIRRDVSLPGGDGILLTLVAVEAASQGGALPNDAASVQRDLADAVAGTIAASKGSATARVRGAIDHAQALLRQRRAVNPAAEAVAASIGVLLLIGDEAILALVGPWLAHSLSSEDPDARPASLNARGQQPLGVGEPWTDAVEPPPISWSQLRLEQGTSVLVAPESLGDVLPLELVASLPSLPAAEAGERIEAVVPSDAPVLYVARPAAQQGESPAGGTQPDEGRHAPDRTPPVGGDQPDVDDKPPRHEPAEDSRTPAAPVRRMAQALSSTAAAAVILAARVVRGMLPARSAPDEYREDWARIAAAVALAVPVGAVLLALAMLSLAGNPANQEPGAAMAETAPAGELGAVSDGEIGAAQPTAAVGQDGGAPFADMRKVAELTGATTDQRRLVAVDGRPFVLNVETDSVQQVTANGPQAVLARGQVVGDETVAELLDLFWLAAPGGGAGGRVAALDAAGRVWAIGDGGVRLVDRSGDPQWGAVSIAAGYDGNLYALDRSAGQIYRYGPDPSGFPSYLEPGMAWLAQAEPLAAATDMAIDGAIFVLSGDGSVRRRVAGQPDDAPGLMSPRTSDAPALYTSPTAGKLLLADRANGRVVVLATDGRQLEELTPVGDVGGTPGRFGALHDVWWDESGGRLYIVDGDELHEAPYH